MLSSGRLKIRVDGPYGVGRLRWARYPVVVLVAGGIGITPGISIASHLVKEASMVGPSQGGWHLLLLWVIRDGKHARWFEEELTRLAALAARPDVPVSFDVTRWFQGIKNARVVVKSTVVRL